MEKKKVIIVGGGFGGLLAAKEFKDTDFDVTIIDKTNHHLFQPLLYQVAAAALSPADIAIPIRSVFSEQKNIKVVLDEVIAVDKEKSIIKLSNSEMSFDYLILSPGARHSYFGNDNWEKYAPGLKTLSDALKIRELDS
jgi:NADH:ubiquinone reductase (H+-translocating)